MMLTPRQREVAGLVARGMSAPAIANTIGISAETVKVHIREAADRLAGDSRPRQKLTLWFFHLSPESEGLSGK
jgi:DNA-binding NarL/FixJ family response regulator